MIRFERHCRAGLPTEVAHLDKLNRKAKLAAELEGAERMSRPDAFPDPKVTLARAPAAAPVLTYGKSKTLPVVARLSNARCASAAAASGYVAPIRTFNFPASTAPKRSSVRAPNSAVGCA